MSASLRPDVVAPALERAVASHATDNGPGLVMGVVDPTGLVATRGLGRRSLSEAQRVDERTAFYLASVSKQFTAACSFIAMDEGLLSANEPVTKYVVELPSWAERIEVRHLLSHSGGLPEYLEIVEASGRSVDGALTDDEILDLLSREQRPLFPAGSTCRYSNTGYWLLGVVLARASGLRLRQFADRAVFGPLGMSRTFYRDDFAETVPHLADGHMPSVEGFRRWITQFDRVGDGGVISNLEDLAQWESAVLRRDQPWSGIAQRSARSFPLNDGFYAQDWRAGVVVDELDGHEAILVGGTGFGYRAFGARLVDEQIAVYALSNLGTMDVRGATLAVIPELV